MLQFAWPWVFALLPLPILVRMLSGKQQRSDEAALRVPYLEDFMLSEGRTDIHHRRWPIWMYALLWIAFLSATARPQWIGEAIELPVSGRDIVLAIDLSQSMAQRFNFDRRELSKIYATKQVASDFISRRVGDRIGLILFGSQAYVQSPLTFDRESVRTLLMEAQPGLAGRSTAIGDAIGLTVKRMPDQGDERILILLTDGVSNAGELKPEKAAEIARDRGLKIHTIGVGEARSRDLDERTLKNIAEMTGGRYFRARDPAELSQIYQLIDELEPVEQEAESYRPTWSLFYWPLSAAMALASILLVARWRGWA